MNVNRINAVIGAFGYTGKYIADKLLNSGIETITLTNKQNKFNLFDGKIKAFPLDFANPKNINSALTNVEVLYNTYWVRFNHKNFNHNDAVNNTKKIFQAAKDAGVQRIVHISITNPSIDSPLEYFRGKAILEKELIDSGISYAILRPAVIFGKEDILINNIAWFIRKFPIFGVLGKGDYRLQPIYVDDLAELAVKYGASRENIIIDAIGPETFTYKELVKTIMNAINVHKPIINIPYQIGYILAKFTGWVKNDVTITKPEIEGLMANLLFTNSPPAGRTKLSDWAKSNSVSLGINYANELSRRK